MHESIKNYAVTCLSNERPTEVQDYLIQLVQALKYEMNHDSYIAKYLLKLAIRYPLTLGHSLFWHLRVEMHNPNVQQRFGLNLEVFLNKIGRNVRQIFEEQSLLIKSLLKVAYIPHFKSLEKEKQKLEKFRLNLENINSKF